MRDLAYIGVADGFATHPMLCINSAAEADAAYLAGKIDDDMRAACVRWFMRGPVRQVTLVMSEPGDCAGMPSDQKGAK